MFVVGLEKKKKEGNCADSQVGSHRFVFFFGVFLIILKIHHNALCVFPVTSKHLRAKKGGENTED